jgi:alpha-beta hydrolase superfamily lysophospholipase
MSRLSRLAALVLVGGLFFTGSFLGETIATAQAPTQPKITTVDGVKLNATFYPSAKKNSPVVIMVHPIGEGKKSKTPEWTALAETLQKQDFAVITFDLRGHGDSTTVDPEIFWGKPKEAWDLAQQFNRKNVKLTKEPEVLEVKDFIKNPIYLPALANDIAAIRSYLDRQNDMGECNTANILVIGADNGATLAALWINAEWSRFKYTPPANPMFPKSGILDKRAEGADIIGAVFLSIQPNLDPKRLLKVSGLLRNACKDHATATAFFSGKDDVKSRDFAKELKKVLKLPDDKKHEYINAYELNTNLSGIKLLQEGLMTDKLIAKYLSVVVENRGAEWGQRDFVNTWYMWVTPFGKAQVPAKHLKGQKNLNFDSYERFINNP